MPRTTRPPKVAAGSRRRLDPVKEIQIEVVTDGPAKGWVHTHGPPRMAFPSWRSAGSAEHYRTPRLGLVDPPEAGCACDECAKWRRRFAS